MNRILLLLIASLLFFLTSGCKDDNKVAYEVTPVSNITYEQKPGGVLFKWDNPETDLSYVEILFKKETNSTEPERVIVQSPVTEQLIYGLPDTYERIYTFIAHRDEAVSEPVTIAAQAGTTPFDKLAASIKVSLNLEGVKVSWDNEESGEFYLNMNIDSVKTNPDYEIVIKETGSGERQIPISGILSAELLFTVGDVYGNESIPVVRNYKKLENGWLDRSIWAVADYSSQEETQEQDVGGHLNSRASCVLDGYTNTFWHTRWSSNVPGKYPHYITFDLRREVNLERARIVRRLNNTNLNTFEIQGGPSKDGPWTKIVEYVIQATNNPQTIEFTSPVQYRYIRFYCTKGGGGNVHASLAEFELYGQDIEEE